MTNDDQIEFHRRKQPQRERREEGNRDFELARSLARSTNGQTAAFVTTVTPEINDSGAGGQTSPVNVRGTLALALPRRKKLGEQGG